MLAHQKSTERIPGYCALCISRCGSIAVVENGRFVALEPDPSHPTGQALCAKGRAAPELVYNTDRLLYPLKRTRPKGDPDPGWQRISWDEALDLTASRLRHLAEQGGPESVVFTTVSSSTSAAVDSNIWVQRLMYAFGSPNLCNSMELCAWGRGYAPRYTFGTGMGLPGTPMPDLENAGCILFWGYNPSLARLDHATATVAALKRGAHLIVVDPRRVGLASKADLWLQVRPGSDGALALGFADAARSWDRERHDRARLVRSRFRPRLDERAVARARGHRTIANRARPLANGQRAAVHSLGPSTGSYAALRPSLRPLRTGGC